ncbi:MAG TPA: mechanosensitive ion channel [Caulobacterales bacterium]|nr:mechanosensitive ion channel [Caulobacterales bacterium]
MVFAGLNQDQLLIAGRNVAIAIIILVIAHFAAKAVKWAVAKAVDRIPFFPRREQVAGLSTQPPTRIGERVGDVAYWLVWLLGLMAALRVLQIPGTEAVIAPLNQMVSGFLAYIPNVVGAALIFFIGFALATIVRRMVEAAVEALELDRRLADAGLTRSARGANLSRLLGLLVFTLIIIPVSIAALNALGISSISDPATNMLNEILATIPSVISAALIIFIAYLVGRWVGVLAEEGLQSIGFDEAIRAVSAAEPVRAGLAKSDPTPSTDSLHVEGGGFPPSRIVGIAVMVGIVLFASVQATAVLGFGAMSNMLNEVLSLATRVLFGAVIIAIGVLLANILAAAAAGRASPSAEIMSVFVRWGVVALAAAVGLRFMGLANDIIALAFGLVLGAVAVAVAIAFGIGGRDAAKRLVDRWTSS